MDNLGELAWTVIDGAAVFLDIDRDRYFRLAQERERTFVASLTETRSCYPVQPSGLPLPDSWEPPSSASPAMAHGPFQLGEVARAIWMQRRTERRLGSRCFKDILLQTRHVLEGRAFADISDGDRLLRTVRAFEQARLLRSAADRCLPRSIALSLCLAARGCRTHVVLGVKLAPFAAHCWVQAGAAVLNDSLEEVQRYSPILVL